MQRVRRPASSGVQRVMHWAMEIAGSGSPLPPLGFIADVGHLVLGEEDEPNAGDFTDIPDWPQTDIRTYEDYVLGKLYADFSFERAAAAIAHYKTDRDHAKGLAFLINQFETRAGFGGVVLSPSVVKHLSTADGAELLTEAWESLSRDGLDPLLLQLYADLTIAVRNTGDVLAGADVFELEHGTALAEFGQRVALRQVLHAAAELEDALPHQPARTPARRQQVPTHVLEEDMYPVGGFTSLSNRGTIESLLHSQLAYMESMEVERPDLFDIKFLRDELLYYSRDENQFLRRRRTFVFALYPDLAECRVKDPDLPCQRIILLLALIVTLLRRLIDWLSDDSLTFELLFLETENTPALTAERELLEMIFREQIANGTVLVETVRPGQISPRCHDHARRSLCHCLTLSPKDRRPHPENTTLTRLQLTSPVPRLRTDDDLTQPDPESPPWTHWQSTVETLLQRFV